MQLCQGNCYWLLVGAELEILGGKFEAQRVGSQGVGHVLVAFSTVLQQEGTPVGLRGADQLQALRGGHTQHKWVCTRYLTTVSSLTSVWRNTQEYQHGRELMFCLRQGQHQNLIKPHRVENS